MKRSVLTILAAIAMIGITFPALAQINDHQNHRFSGDIDLDGNWSVKGTKITVTGAQLNSAGGGSSSTITPSLITNLNGVLSYSNATLRGTLNVVGQTTEGVLNVVGPIYGGQGTNKFIVRTNGAIEGISATLTGTMAAGVVTAGGTNLNAQITTQGIAETNAAVAAIKTELDTVLLKSGGTNILAQITTQGIAETNAAVAAVKVALDTVLLQSGGTNVLAQITTESGAAVTAGTNALRGDIADGILITGASTISNANTEVATSNLIVFTKAILPQAMNVTNATACAFDFSPTVTNDGIATWFSFTATNGEVYVFPAKQLCD